MALLPARQRDQIMFMICFLAVALVAAFYVYVWEPAKSDLDESQARTDSLVVLNQRSKSELAQGRTKQLRAEAERYGEELALMRRLVPTSNEVPALLEQVSTAARRVGIEIGDVQPLPVLSGDTYDAFKYRMSVRGTYHQVGDFLANVGSLQRIVAPINLTLVPASADQSKAGARVKAQPLEAKFEIQTYVERATVRPPAAPNKPAPDPGKPGER